MGKSVFLIIFFSVLILFLVYSTGYSTPSPGKSAQVNYQILNTGSAEDLLKKAKKIENSDPSLSEILARKVLLYSITNNNELLEVQSQLQIARILVVKTKYTEAMKIALQARELAEKLKAKKEIASYFEVAGKIRTNSGDYDQSLGDLFVALNYYDKLKDINGRSRALNSIGNVYYWQKDFKKAMDYYIQALSIAILMRDTIQQARSVNNIGIILMARKDYKNALQNYSNAMILNQKTGQDLRVGGNLLNIGIIYMNLKMYNESKQSYIQALSIFRKFENYLNIALCYLDLGYYYEAINDKDSCLLTFKESYNLANHYGFKGIELEAVTKLHELYRDDKMIDSAYKYSTIKAGIKDSIELEKSITRLSLAELQYKYENKINEQKLEHQRLNYLSLSTTLALISIILFSILFISRQRQKTKAIAMENKTIALEKKSLTDELEFKNRELTLNVMNLLKRNEFIINTSQRLLDFNADQPADVMKDELFRIAKSLQNETDKEQWEEFEIRFKEVHAGFYDRLLEQFPDLTPNELKICGLLRLNLTTKEISELTGQRRETIEKARFRLRKHLGLVDPKINLVTLLSKI